MQKRLKCKKIVPQGVKEKRDEDEGSASES